MGLLDSLFDPSTYGGQGGGLLDLIRAAQMQQSQYQPAPGFPDQAPSASFAERFNALPNAPQPFQPSGRQFDTASFNPATYAPNQAQPIAVGTNQMPRMGDAGLYQGSIPTNAQPTQGQLPASPQQAPQGMSTDFSAQGRQPQPEQALPPALGNSGGLGAAARGFVNNLHTGPIGALVGGIGNALGMQSPEQQNLRAEYEATRQALIGNGVPERQANSTAMLAVMNKDAGKVVLPELLSNRQKFEKLKDGFGNEVPIFVDTVGHGVTDARTGKPYGQGGAASGDMQAMTDKITQMRAQGATKEQMLGMIPTGYRDDVASLIAGKAVPANMGRSEVRGKLITLAKTVDPGFDETMIPTRVAMRKDFAGEGKNGQSIGALNTVQHHADQVSDAISEFEKAGGGSDSPLWNAGKLMLANNTSYDPKLRDAAQKLKDKLNATEHEVASAYNAGHLSDHDLKTWNEVKAENLPAGQLKQKLADFVDLLNGKRDSLNHMYQTTFGEDAPGIDKATNIATTAKIQKRLPQYAGSDTATSQPSVQEGATATNPQTGAKITFKNGKWQ